MAAEEKKEEAPEAAAAPAGPKMILGMKLPIFLLFVLNALVMSGGLGYVIYVKLLYKKPAITDTMVVTELEKKVALAPPIENKKLFTEAYKEMTVNLRTSPGGKSHYATVDLSLGCHTEECISELKGSRAKIEDIIQTAIASRTYTELNSLESKSRLKFEIQQQVNSFLKDKPVTDVFFENFVVQ